MNHFDAKLTLTAMRINNVLFVEHAAKKNNGAGSPYQTGKFYAIVENQNLVDITQHIAAFMFISLVKEHNPKRNRGEFCITTRSPESLIRDISQELYGSWKKINLSILEFNNIF